MVRLVGISVDGDTLYNSVWAKICRGHSKFRDDDEQQQQQKPHIA